MLRIGRRVRPRGDDGVGLLGVLAVIVILGVMAALAVVALQGAGTPAAQGGSVSASDSPTGTPNVATPVGVQPIDQMAVAACQAVVAEVRTALSVYAAEHGGVYPSSLRELVPSLLKTDPMKSLVRGQTMTYFATGGAVTANCK